VDPHEGPGAFGCGRRVGADVEMRMQALVALACPAARGRGAFQWARYGGVCLSPARTCPPRTFVRAGLSRRRADSSRLGSVGRAGYLWVVAASPGDPEHAS
jgi:hypothetical protein